MQKLWVIKVGNYSSLKVIMWALTIIIVLELNIFRDIVNYHCKTCFLGVHS